MDLTIQSADGQDGPRQIDAAVSRAGMKQQAGSEQAG